MTGGPLRYSGWQFAFFRITFGGYLFVHFTQLMSYAPEIDSPQGTALFAAVLALLAVAFTLGWQRPWVALILGYGWTCLFLLNAANANPALPTVG